MHFDELPWNFPHIFPLERNLEFERRFSKLFSSLHHRRWECRFFNEIHIFYMKFLLPSFTWEKCQPLLPTGGVVCVWTENREIFSPHSLLHMRVPFGKRNSQFSAPSAYKRKCSWNRTPFTSLPRTKFPFCRKRVKNKPSHRKNQQKICEKATQYWKVHICVI